MPSARLVTCSLALSIFACGVQSSLSNDSEDITASEASVTAYRVELTTTSQVQPGTTAQLSIRVLDPNSKPVTAFDDLHTQTMHVVAVSSDLRDFLHIHPTVAGDGSLSVTAPIALAQPYKFFFEYDPAGAAGEQTSRANLYPVGGTAAVSPKLATAPGAFDGSATTTTVSDATRVELQPVAHGMIMSGTATTFRVAVKTETGSPATDLVDWLGMPGHAIVVSEDTSTFIHAHAVRAGTGTADGGHGGHDGMSGMGGSGGAGNLLDIAVTLPSSGFYKMFVQVKRGERVVTAPFVLKAMEM